MIRGQDHPNISPKVHPPVLLLAHILAAFMLNGSLPFPLPFPKALDWTGYVLVLAGLGLGFSAVNRFVKAHTTLDPHGSVTEIITSGPYRFSRNPIYLGFVCTLIGLPAALGNYWGAALSPVLMVFLYQLVIQHEEIYMEKKFGEVYISYKSRVRRWL